MENHTRIDNIDKRLTIVETGTPLEIKNLRADIANLTKSIDLLTVSVREQSQMNEVFRGQSAQQLRTMKEVNETKLELSNFRKSYEEHEKEDREFHQGIIGFKAEIKTMLKLWGIVMGVIGSIVGSVITALISSKII